MTLNFHIIGIEIIRKLPAYYCEVPKLGQNFSEK